MSQNVVNSFEDVIDQLGQRELAAGTGANPHQPRDWRIRKRIPAEWWARMVAYAQSVGRADISLEVLADIASKRGDKPKPDEAA